tara:strand:- start:477 stop:680 length:204 start_codon:yes stop_codon:yes gene_type:complete
MPELLMDGGGGFVPPSTPVIASDGMSDDDMFEVITFNYHFHNEMVDGPFHQPLNVTEDVIFSEKGDN